MNIAVISASFGGIDVERPFVEQKCAKAKIDRYFFNEQNSPILLPNLPPRLQAKWFKTQSHKIPGLPRYDYYIWIDANIEVTSEKFVETLMVPLLAIRCAVIIQSHHERSTIREEIEFILGSSNPYLVKRYGEQPLLEEYLYYTGLGMPPTVPLYSCNVFARSGDVVGNGLMDAWWDLCLQWTWFDQSAFSFLAWAAKDKVYTVDMGGVTTSPYYTLHAHTQWNM